MSQETEGKKESGDEKKGQVKLRKRNQRIIENIDSVDQKPSPGKRLKKSEQKKSDFREGDIRRLQANQSDTKKTKSVDLLNESSKPKPAKTMIVSKEKPPTLKDKTQSRDLGQKALNNVQEE